MLNQSPRRPTLASLIEQAIHKLELAREYAMSGKPNSARKLIWEAILVLMRRSDETH